jgi:hypothetical protein
MLNVMYRQIILLVLFFSFPLLAEERCLDIFPAISTEYGAELTLPNFKYSSESDGSLTSSNFSLASGQYKDIKVDDNGVGYFSELNAEYRMKKLELNKNSTMQFVAGDYWMEELKVEKEASIAIVGAGTVRIYAEKITIDKEARINDANGNLILISYDDITIEKDVYFTGVLYADNDIEIEKDATLIGAITGKDVSIADPKSATYQESSITNSDFNGMCGLGKTPVNVVANYQFEECEYTGVGNEVIDQTGNYDGQISGISSSSSNAVINRALDLSATSTNDWVTLPNETIDGLDDFSISVWINTSVSKSQQEIFHALGSSASDDELEIYLVNSSTVNVKVRDNSQNLSTGSSVTNGQWHHLVVTRVDKNVCLFVDGNLKDCGDSVDAGVLSVPNNNSIVIGQEQDSFEGQFSSSQSFEGNIDEFIIFDGVITADEISTIYSHQNNGNNYDGSTRDAVQCFELIAQFSMDELSWSGRAGEIIDETGNFNTQAINGAVTDNELSARTGNPGTCGYGIFDGKDDYIQLDDDPRLDLKSELSISVWINPKVLPSSGLKTIVSKDENYEFHLQPSGEINWWWRTHSFSTSGAAIKAGSWYHIAITYRSGKQVIYVNGIEKGSRTYTGDLTLNNDPFQIGQDQGISSRFFEGYIDEVHVFKGALTATEINEVYAKTHACAEPVIHHYEIVHDGNGLTCDVEPITIKACVNSDCSTLSSESVSLDFQVTGSITPLITKASPTFTGSTTFNFSHTELETLQLSIANATLSATNTVECSGFGASCAMTFANAGFRFLYGISNELSVPSQTSGIEFPEELKLQAVKDSLGVCEGIFSGDVDVSLAQQNVVPNDNDGLSFQAAGVTIAKYSSFTDSITLSFNGDSIATIPNPNYLDAGQIRLHASYSDGDISLIGNSNNFWVKPHRFEITATHPDAITVANPNGNLIGDSAASSITHKAGENFTLNVSALNAQGSVTQNYRQADGQLQIKITRVLPTLNNTIDGSLTFIAGSSLPSSTTAGFQNATLTGFGSGATLGISEFSSAQYSEVGIIDLDIQDIDYGKQALAVEAANITIGRFTPAYFKQTVAETDSAPTVGNFDAYQSAIAGCSMTDWVYAGQRTDDNKGNISYGVEPIIAITAYNASGNITENYTLGEGEGLMKLVETGVDITLPVADDEQLRVGNVVDDFVAITAQMNTGILGESLDDDDNVIAGQKLYTFSSDDHFSYERNDSTLLAPFPAKIRFVTNQIADSDGITLAPTDATEDVVTTGIDIYFARMLATSAFGSEHTALRSPLYLQTYTGSDFEDHASQVCLAPLVGDKAAGDKYDGGMALWDYRLIDIDSDTITVDDSDAGIFGTFDAGTHNNLFFSAPTERGTLEWEYEVPAWLKYNWNGVDEGADSNLYDDNPSATLTFGLYRGNDRIISWREVSN